MTDRSAHEFRTPFDAARVAVLPVPYEATVTYGKGTARGPEAILHASSQVELYDERMGTEPFRAGIWTAPMLPVAGAGTEDVVRAVSQRVSELLDAGKWVVMLGGEHSITPGGVTATVKRHPGLHLVQLDAHADLREEYEGNPWNHACAMARCLGLAPIRAVVGSGKPFSLNLSWVPRFARLKPKESGTCLRR